ncbi:MAG: hypothetical protein RL308_2292 [Bacteroidota bacterium]|jgi:glycosyltransferase involved in cell wall biosynthesis
MNELVSVVIPCYNQAKYLPEALQSIENQTHQSWECIIVNDGSPDETDKVAAEWCAKDSRFNYLYQNNGGLSNARNNGIKQAKGKYILTLDSDDKFEPTFIEKAIKILESNDEIGVVSSWGVRFLENKHFEEFRPRGKSLDDFLFANAAIGTSLFRKKCWEQVGGYDEKMKSGYEDWEFYIRVCQQGWNVHIIEEILFFYRQHQVSMRTVALKKHDKEIRKYIFIKHAILYKEHYEVLIEYFLNAVELEKKQNIKIQNKIDYKLGRAILRPFRSIKTLVKKIKNNN